jgi:hypothetical protein
LWSMDSITSGIPCPRISTLPYLAIILSLKSGAEELTFLPHNNPSDDGNRYHPCSELIL